MQSNIQHFIPSKEFRGKHEGYYFSFGELGLGYYIDKKKSVGKFEHGERGSERKRLAPGEGNLVDVARDGENDHKRKRLDGDVLLREAEAAVEGEDNVIQDAKGLKRAIRALKKKVIAYI